MAVYSRLNRSMQVTNYDPPWPIRFEQEKARIFAALGSSVLMVEPSGLRNMGN